MAFMRYASAVVVHPRATQRGWSRVRTAARAAMLPSRNLLSQATEILGTRFDPDRYLLTHATIVASVDVDKVQNVRLGSVTENGSRINRKYADYYVQPDCSKFINNNGDCWSRSVLMKAYRTFIGAQNFCEHVQIEELSKGRIIDAVARDIGDSVYVDILIATDRKHTDLVSDIESGKMGTLSMGCSVDETTCTKCGNVAVDETELCKCVKYEKLNAFLDVDGNRRVIAELCGHDLLDPTGGVTFIEASWVKSPAFTGAVLRTILEPKYVSASVMSKAQEILSQPPTEWLMPGGMAKAASVDGVTASLTVKPGHNLYLNSPSTPVVARVSDRYADFGFGDEGDGGDSGDSPVPAAPEKAPFQDLEDDVYNQITERVRRRIRDEITKEDNSVAPVSSMAPNDSLVKEAALQQKVSALYKHALTDIVRRSTSDVECVDRVAAFDASLGIKAPVDLYRVALQVGSTNRYSSLGRYLVACCNTLGRSISLSDARTMIRLGKLLSARRSKVPPPSRSRSE